MKAVNLWRLKAQRLRARTPSACASRPEGRAWRFGKPPEDGWLPAADWGSRGFRLPLKTQARPLMGIEVSDLGRSAEARDSKSLADGAVLRTVLLTTPGRQQVRRTLISEGFQPLAPDLVTGFITQPSYRAGRACGQATGRSKGTRARDPTPKAQGQGPYPIPSSRSMICPMGMPTRMISRSRPMVISPSSKSIPNCSMNFVNS
jgi:hypothetical protein